MVVLMVVFEGGQGDEEIKSQLKVDRAQVQSNVGKNFQEPANKL